MKECYSWDPIFIGFQGLMFHEPDIYHNMFYRYFGSNLPTNNPINWEEQINNLKKIQHINEKEETFVDDELENRVINHSNKYIYMGEMSFLILIISIILNIWYCINSNLLYK